MGRLVHHQERAAAQSAAALSEYYGDPVPASAVLLEHYLRAGHIPLCDPDGTGDAASVDLGLAAGVLGGDLAETSRHLHQLHAAGQLTVDQHGNVELIAPPHD